MEELSSWVISDKEPKNVESEKRPIYKRITHFFLAFGGQKSGR